MLTIKDSLGSTASDTVNVIVNPAPATQNAVINVNLYGNSDPYNNAAWNDWNLGGTSLVSAKFKYSDGTASNISAALSTQTAVADNGTTYSVTMCPQKVARYASYYSGSGGRTLMLTGLDSTKLYRIDIFASRFNPSQTSTFSTGAASRDNFLTNNNTASVATFDNLTPVTGGKIVVTVTHGQYYDYINGFTLTEKTVVTPADIIPSADSSILTAFGPDSSLTGNAALAVYPNPIKGGTFELSVNNTYTGMIKVQDRELWWRSGQGIRDSEK